MQSAIASGSSDPSSYSSSSSSISTAFNTYLTSASRRLHDIRTFQLSRLQGCNGPMGLWKELVGEMKGDLDVVWRNLEIARELGEFLLSEEKLQAMVKVDILDRDLADLRISYRQAVISSKKAMSTRSRWHEVFKSTTNGNGDIVSTTVEERQSTLRRDGMGGDALQTKTHEVTDALRRTTTLLQPELERSVVAVQTLDQSTQTLRLTQTLYDSYTSLLTTSGELVKAMERADWWDRALILAAFLLFLLVVGWVIKRRVMDRVVGGVGWWIGGSWKLVKMATGADTGGGGSKDARGGIARVKAAAGSASGLARGIESAAQSEANVVVASLATTASQILSTIAGTSTTTTVASPASVSAAQGSPFVREEL